jgi:hypothetical protein
VTDVDDLLSSPSSRKGRLQRAAFALLRDHAAAGEIPTNGRFLFYELEQRGVVSKVRMGARAPDQDLTDATSHLRKVGLVPWDWLVDESRVVYRYDQAATIAEAVRAAIRSACINPWTSTPPLVLVESRSLGGVLRPLVAEYRCTVAATNGQCGGLLRTDVAPLLRGNVRPVRYLGDLDLSGGQIEANALRVLEREAARDIDWQRVAITREQVDERGLEPILKKDRRYNDGRPHEAWETEALGQGTVLALVRGELDRLLPRPLEDVLDDEDEQRLAALRDWGADA